MLYVRVGLSLLLLAVLILFLLSYPVSGYDVCERDDLVRMVAARVAGEARIAGYVGEFMVAKTVWNRYWLGYGSIPHILESAYYAKDLVPTGWELHIVKDACYDSSIDRGVVYALNRADVRYLKASTDIAYMQVVGDRWALYFYDVWPEGTALMR